jgi:hypothetical protein
MGRQEGAGSRDARSTQPTVYLLIFRLLVGVHLVRVSWINLLVVNVDYYESTLYGLYWI